MNMHQREAIMNDAARSGLVSVVSKTYSVNMHAANEALEIIQNVLKTLLEKHTGMCELSDANKINNMILRRLEKEDVVHGALYHEKVMMVQQCIADVARQETMKYVRSVYYPKSTLLDIFMDMKVDVSGAEACLDSLGESLSPSEKTLLRIMYGEGCTVMQAAEMLGVSPQEVRTIHGRAFASLRQEWLALREALRGREGVKQ